MKFYQSIRFRIIASILVSISLLVILNAGITFFVVGKNISRLVDSLLATEVDYFLYQYDKDRTTPLPHSKYIKGFKGIDRVPPHFKEAVKELPPGIHFIHEQKSKPPIHIAVMELPDTKTPYYMFFHAREFLNESRHLDPRHLLLISLALFLIPCMIIGYFTSRILYAPMVTLMDKIKGLDPENLPVQFSDKHSSNEIGMLTRTLENSMNRIKAFITREKQFTRDASHELRTPLTIVKGAVEIMEQQPEIQTNPLLEKPLKRIARSINDMETTIDTFLWLAREDNTPPGICRVEPVVRKAVSGNKYLIENKDICLTIDAEYPKTLYIREEILFIAITNLVRNAFQFTATGEVTIKIEESFIEILDTGMGISTDQLNSVTRSHVKGDKSTGFGLGLSIVSRLCRRFGWELIMKSTPGKGTRIKILWHDT